MKYLWVLLLSIPLFGQQATLDSLIIVEKVKQIVDYSDIMKDVDSLIIVAKVKQIEALKLQNEANEKMAELNPSWYENKLLAGIVLFSSYAVRTPNVQPNPDDYEVSIGLTHNNFHINRQWERELGEFYIDDLFWAKLEGGKVYFKPEYMNKESHDVRYFKMDWRNKWKDWSYGFTSRNDDDDVFSQNFETFFSFGMNKKKTYWKVVDVEISFDGYLPPDEEGRTTKDTFEYEDKFKVSWKLTNKITLYNLGEVSKLQGKEFYKGKIGIEVSL